MPKTSRLASNGSRSKIHAAWGLTPQSLRALRALRTPARIQKFIDDIPYQYADTAWSPQRVLRERKGHCLEGALVAAAASRLISGQGHDGAHGHEGDLT